MTSGSGAAIGLLWRGDVGEPPPDPDATRFRDIFRAFESRGVAAQPVLYDEASHDAVRTQLLSLDGVLVWVDPIVREGDRTALDALLAEVAAAGVLVSARPEVILTMGTKEVLHRTRHLPWGTNTDFYRTPEEMLLRMPERLRQSGSRVLKQDRGSSGFGVWKVTLRQDVERGTDMLVAVQSAERGARPEEMTFSEFVELRRSYLRYFGGRGGWLDQPYVAQSPNEMIRAYFVHDRVAGFGHQFVTALTPGPSDDEGPPDPEPRIYFGPDEPRFRSLRRLLESSWVGLMQRELGLEREALPIIWDADFLVRPSDSRGDDAYVLCEINVSGVFPIPDEAVAPLVDATIERIADLHLEGDR